MPWTSEAVSKLSAVNDVSKLAKGTPKGIAGKKLSPEELERAKKNLVKPVFKQTAKKETVSEEPKKKKGLFGLF